MSDGEQTSDPRQAMLCSAIRRLVEGGAAAWLERSGEGDALDRALVDLRAVDRELTALRGLAARVDARLAQLTETTLAIASLDYTKPAEISDEGDAFDAVAVALNMMIEELKSSTAFVNNILAAMADALLVVDLNGSLKSVNDAALRLLGYAKDALVGRPLDTIFVLRHADGASDASARGGRTGRMPPPQSPAARLIDDLTREPRVFLAEAGLVTREGEPIPVSLSASPLRAAQGEVTGFVLVARDIRERKRSEEEQRQLKEAIRSKEAALAELSTPIIPIADDILVLPLIGAMDAVRAAQMTEVLLQGITTSRARVAIIDVTGVPVVDAEVADGLLRAVRATSLVGAKVVLTGIRADVAQTMIALGIDLRGIVTRSSLKDGIAYAVQAQGGGQTHAR